MIKKYHSHTPQTNLRHREEESQNIYSNKTSVRQYKATSSLFLFKIFAKLERKKSNAQQNKDKHRTPTTNGKHTKQQINNNNTTALKRSAA